MGDSGDLRSTRLEIEAAISGLWELLSEAEPPLEARMQQYFEDFPIALHALGFDQVIPHPTLEYSDGVQRHPDFMGWGADGTATVIEIKRAIEGALVLGPDRRPRESADLTAAIAQGREYVEFFSDRAHRDSFEEMNELPAQAAPPLILIIGRSTPEERIARLVVERDRGMELLIRSYDEVLNDLEAFRLRTFGDREGIDGVSVHLLLRAHCKGGAPGTVFTAGDRRRGKLKGWLGPNCELRLEVFPPGEDRCLTVGSMPGTPALPDGVLVLVSFEFGSGPDFSSAGIYVDGSLIAETHLAGPTHLPSNDFVGGFRPGASPDGDPSAPMAIAAMGVTGRTTSVWERRQLRIAFEEENRRAGSAGR